MKCYSAASIDLTDTITAQQAAHHPDLEHVTVGALFIHDDESGDPVLKHNGYWAAAVVSITPLKQRALGMPDALIVVDRALWQTHGAARRHALIDHELQHLTRKREEPSGTSAGGPVFDAVGRPALAMRKHDHQLGWFDAVARRHGDDSVEVAQARELVATTQQLYFNFAEEKARRPKGGRSAADRLVPLPSAATIVKLIDDDGWPKWSQDNQRYENRDGTPYDGLLAEALEHERASN